MKIFDRWGQMVFESKDLKNGWDGKVNGRYAQEGVYVTWFITPTCYQRRIQYSGMLR